MKCKKCNTVNRNENKFCISCGAELQNDNTIFCSGCGTENESTNNYCVKCGSSLSHKSSGKNRDKNPKRIRHNRAQPKNLNLFQEIKKHKIIVTAVLALFMFLVFKSIPKTEEYNNIQLPSQNNYNALAANVNTDSRVTEIANRFICPCGDCKDSLETCTCDKATEERNFIKEELNKNISDDGIVISVASKYGMLKSKYEKQYKVDNSKVYYEL